MDGSALGYAELLRLAVSHGLHELTCSIVQYPSETNDQHAVVLATARTAKLAVQSLGEARRSSLPDKQSDYLLSVAEHRARIRALCDAVGMPQTLADTLDFFGGARGDMAASTGAKLEFDNHVEDNKIESRETPHRHDRSDLLRSLPVSMPEDTLSSDAMQSQTALEADTAVTPRSRTLASEIDLPHGTERPPQASSKLAYSVMPAGGLSPDIVSRLIKMTRRKADAEGTPISEEEAMERLNSFFQRAFGHALSEGTRMEGQRVVQRLASELARLGADQQAATQGAT